ncbi:unnamed protein product [Musa hybrid cultivar]
MEFDLENQMSSSDDEQQPRWGSISALFAAEADHIISTVGAIDPSARRNAVSLVLQAQFNCNLDPFVACLAINYIDRYLTKREIPIEKPWIVRLLSISCLSLASKMKKTCKPLADFLVNRGSSFSKNRGHMDRFHCFIWIEFAERGIFCVRRPNDPENGASGARSTGLADAIDHPLLLSPVLHFLLLTRPTPSPPSTPSPRDRDPSQNPKRDEGAGVQTFSGGRLHSPLRRLRVLPRPISSLPFRPRLLRIRKRSNPCHKESSFFLLFLFGSYHR